MMKKYCLAIFIGLFAMPTLQAQRQIQKVFRTCDEAYENKEYFKAYKCYKEAWEFREYYKGEPVELLYRYATAAKMFNYFTQADTLFKLLSNIDPTIYPDIYARSILSLAQTKHTLAQDSSYSYSEALAFYDRFLNEQLVNKIDGGAEEKNQLLRQAESGRVSCLFALNLGVEILADTAIHLPAGINTVFGDMGMAVLRDTFYYSSLKFIFRKDKNEREYAKILYVEQSNPFMTSDTLPLVMPVNGIFNKDGVHTANPTFSMDGNTMYFSSCQYKNKYSDEITCSLYKRKRLATGDWGSPIYLNINVDSTLYSSTHPSIALNLENNTEWLLFSSDRNGTKGGMDLWASAIEGDQMGTPVNMSAINTNWNEITPHYHAPSGRLFFSSNRDTSYALYDIFVASQAVGQSGWDSWCDAQNMGQTYNSGYNDYFFYLIPEGDMAYFASDRPRSLKYLDEIEACCPDIYAVPQDVYVTLLVTASCSPDQIGEPLDGVSIQVTELKPDGAEDNIIELSPGSYKLKSYRSYRIEASHPDFPGLQVDSVVYANVVASCDRPAKDTLLFQLTPNYIEVSIPVSAAEDGRILSNAILEVLDEEFETVEPINGVYRFQLGKEYSIQARAECYQTGAFSQRYDEPSCDPKVFPVRLALTPPSANIEVYFDNDMPYRLNDKRVTKLAQNGPADRAGESYKSSWDRYSVRFLDYLKYVKRASSPDKYIEDSIAIAAFFDREVQQGMDNLEQLGRDLERFFDNCGADIQLTIEIESHCSPLGSNEYNELLSKRRIECIKKYLAEDYKNGALGALLDTRIFICSDPRGEFDAPAGKIPTSASGSIYDLNAALERRVSITGITIGKKLDKNSKGNQCQ
ncbi:MAG TPA: hypothetical protein PKA00_12230 [Saprospiraceae bacterium]|nr:hypothetical protein [Saprospiraceae bacterium]HMQ83674.1 hypothetical protein [Saprospiraceae bacterium]